MTILDVLDCAEMFGKVPAHMTMPADLVSRRRFRCQTCKRLYFGEPRKLVYCGPKCDPTPWTFESRPDVIDEGLPDPNTPILE